MTPDHLRLALDGLGAAGVIVGWERHERAHGGDVYTVHPAGSDTPLTFDTDRLRAFIAGARAGAMGSPLLAVHVVTAGEDTYVFERHGDARAFSLAMEGNPDRKLPVRMVAEPIIGRTGASIVLDSERKWAEQARALLDAQVADDGLTREQEEAAMRLAQRYQSVSPKLRPDGEAKVLCFESDPPENVVLRDSDADDIYYVTRDGNLRWLSPAERGDAL